MSRAFDVVVAGAGPAGMTAATTAAALGMSVCLVDDNPAVGGQIWRGGVGKYARNTKVEAWFRNIPEKQIEIRTGTRVIAADASRASLRVEKDSTWQDLTYSSLILATGARELFLPFPGWTVPGVFGVGGLQAFVKSGLDIRNKRVVVAGTGPLLLAVTDSLTRAGARVVASVEQAPLSKLAKFSLHLATTHPGKLLEGAGYAMRTFGSSYRTGHWVSRVDEEGSVKQVTITNGIRSSIFEVDMLAVGYHLIPNTELAQLLQCNLENGYVQVNERQQTSIPNVYGVGESTGIGGVEKAQLEGRIAALSIGGEVDRVLKLQTSREHQLQFTRRLAETFQLRPELRKLADDMYRRGLWA